MAQLVRVRTVVTVAAAVLVLAAATATAATLITGADVKNGSLTGDDIKDGSLTRSDMGGGVKNSLPVRVGGALPTGVFRATNDTVMNTADGVTFGPYADGGTGFGSICTSILDGQPLSDVKHLAFIARYTAEGNTGGIGVPYLRVFLEGTDPNRPDHLLSEHAAARPGHRRRPLPHLGRDGRPVEVQR